MLERKVSSCVVLCAIIGCIAPPTNTESSSLDLAIQRRQANLPPLPINSDAQQTAHGPLGPTGPTSAGAAGQDETLATVDGTAILRSTVVDLLMRAHGPGVLDQLIGLELARQFAETKGIVVSEDDVRQELESALQRLADPLASVNSPSFDRAEAERLLDDVLAQRNISRDEFRITVRRNAYLRKCVQATQQFTESELREEYDRAYGRRVQVRHIQLGSPGDVARVQERLAEGEDFAEVAAGYSANSASAARGGLLEPFSVTESDLPQAFRQAAFALQPGEVSAPVRVGAWEHLIKLERVIEPVSISFEAVREELIHRCRERVTDEQMRRLSERLFREARVDVADPTLRAELSKLHGISETSGP